MPKRVVSLIIVSFLSTLMQGTNAIQRLNQLDIIAHQNQIIAPVQPVPSSIDLTGKSPLNLFRQHALPFTLLTRTVDAPEFFDTGEDEEDLSTFELNSGKNSPFAKFLTLPLDTKPGVPFFGNEKDKSADILARLLQYDEGEAEDSMEPDSNIHITEMKLLGQPGFKDLSFANYTFGNIDTTTKSTQRMRNFKKAGNNLEFKNTPDQQTLNSNNAQTLALLSKVLDTRDFSTEPFTGSTALDNQMGNSLDLPKTSSTSMGWDIRNYNMAHDRFHSNYLLTDTNKQNKRVTDYTNDRNPSVHFISPLSLPYQGHDGSDETNKVLPYALLRSPQYQQSRNQQWQVKLPAVIPSIQNTRASDNSLGRLRVKTMQPKIEFYGTDQQDFLEYVNCLRTLNLINEDDASQMMHKLFPPTTSTAFTKEQSLSLNKWGPWFSGNRKIIVWMLNNLVDKNVIDSNMFIKLYLQLRNIQREQIIKHGIQSGNISPFYKSISKQPTKVAYTTDTQALRMLINNLYLDKQSQNIKQRNSVGLYDVNK